MKNLPRTLIDLVVLCAIVAVFAFGVGRFVWNGLAVASAYNRSEPPGPREVLQSWWGSRELPHRGTDLLAVLERRGTLEGSNEMVGGVLLRHLNQGGEGVELIIPADLELMSSQVITFALDRADGSQIVKEVPVFDEERLERISPLPVRTSRYDPALATDQVALLPEPKVVATFPHGWANLYAPPADGSGVFVLHTTADRDGILLVPLELSPVGPGR